MAAIAVRAVTSAIVAHAAGSADNAGRAADATVDGTVGATQDAKVFRVKPAKLAKLAVQIVTASAVAADRAAAMDNATANAMCSVMAIVMARAKDSAMAVAVVAARRRNRGHRVLNCRRSPQMQASKAMAQWHSHPRRCVSRAATVSSVVHAAEAVGVVAAAPVPDAMRPRPRPRLPAEKTAWYRLRPAISSCNIPPADRRQAT